MTQAAWTCLLLPLGATVLITLLGGSISRRTAGWISTLSSGAAFAAAVVYVPVLQQLFGTAALGPATLAVIAPFPFIVWGIDELRRLSRRRQQAQLATVPIGP